MKKAGNQEVAKYPLYSAGLLVLGRIHMNAGVCSVCCTYLPNPLRYSTAWFKSNQRVNVGLAWPIIHSSGPIIFESTLHRAESWLRVKRGWLFDSATIVTRCYRRVTLAVFSYCQKISASHRLSPADFCLKFQAPRLPLSHPRRSTLISVSLGLPLLSVCPGAGRLHSPCPRGMGGAP